MIGGKRCRDCIMIDFYEKGSLKKNDVIVNPNHHNDSTSYPILPSLPCTHTATESLEAKTHQISVSGRFGLILSGG
jgi:hypothetical protein